MQSTVLTFQGVNFSDGSWGCAASDEVYVPTKIEPKTPGVDPMTRVEVRDFVHSNRTDLVGVVLGVDSVTGSITVYIGKETATFYCVGERFVRTTWDAERMIFAWESVAVLRDDAT